MSFSGDPFALYGKLIIEDHHASLLEKLPRITYKEGEPDPLDITDDTLALLLRPKVGILGAGIGGLYTALILDSLDIEYEILEASDRVGGRLKTHKFAGGNEFDYYEEGAMRFPLPKKDSSGKYKNGTMKRLAELTEYPPLNQGANPLRDQLIPYYYVARDPQSPCFSYFNGIHYPVGGTNEPSGFKAKDMGVAAAYINAGASSIQGDAINPFVRILINDLEKGTKDGWAVMKKNDTYSVRSYLASKYLPSYSLDLPPEHLSSNIVNWLNLVNGSSGGYDRALTESVFSAMAFANIGGIKWGEVDWKCFKSGSETLSNTIFDYLRSKNPSFVKFNQRVTSIHESWWRFLIPGNYEGKSIPASADRTVLDSGIVKVDIVGDQSAKWIPIRSSGVNVITTTEDGESSSHYYGHVISTLPLSVLRTVDLTGAGLSIMQANALRALDYGPSIKIAVRFKTPWWTTKLGIVGGQSFTDLPIRTIVYPSYGVDSATPSTVLIASYSWTTDASRLGALALQPTILKDLVLRNLAEAHRGVNGNNEITYDFLVGELAEGENFHIKDWNNDQYSMGAFAYFSPGEFGKLYTSLSHPAANGCLHFAGEALSTRHAWVVGALDSAWKAVYQYLCISGQRRKFPDFFRLWGSNTEWVTASTILENAPKHTLLDEHIALLRKAASAGIL